MSGFKRKLWEQQFKEITSLLKHSLKSSDKYARKIFENEEQFYLQESKRFVSSLKNTKTINATFHSQNIYNQLAEKFKALNELFFPERAIGEVDAIRIKSSRIARVLQLLERSERSIQSKIYNENIRSLLQEQSKLNMREDLFIFKSYILEQTEDNPTFIARRESFPETTRLQMKVIHGYFQEEATKIICANLPTFGSYREVFNKSMESKEMKEFKESQSKGEGKGMGEDNESNSKLCFTYFGHAMQLDFFNSLLQPVSLNSYIRRFSIIEDTHISRGLILGALHSLPSNLPELDDSDEEERWEDEVEKMAKEFCRFFEGYFEGEEESAEVLEVAGKIAALRRKKKESVGDILRRYWCG